MQELVNSINLGVDKLLTELKNHSAEFCTQAEYDNNDDLIWDLPRVYTVDKYNYHIEWGVLRIENGIAYLGSIGEDYGDFKEIEIGELNAEELITIGNQLI